MPPVPPAPPAPPRRDAACAAHAAHAAHAGPATGVGDREWEQVEREYEKALRERDRVLREREREVERAQREQERDRERAERERERERERGRRDRGDRGRGRAGVWIGGGGPDDVFWGQRRNPRDTGPLPEEGPAPGGARWFRVRVTDVRSGKVKVNVSLPMGLINFGLKLGAKYVPEESRL